MENLKKQAELVIIVPCEEGEEKVFVQNDSYLNNVVEKDDTGVPQNVLSPNPSKRFGVQPSSSLWFWRECTG